MSGDEEQEYFADGITEDLITELARFQNLVVIARNSTFTYKGKATRVKDVARDLGVHYVVEGSVRRRRSNRFACPLSQAKADLGWDASPSRLVATFEALSSIRRMSGIGPYRSYL
jgi:hypothetical protein